MRRSLPRRVARIVLRVFLWMFLGIVGLLGIAWMVLLILFPDDRIRRLMIEQIEARTGLAVEAGELELHILRGLVLRDVALRAPPGFSERPVSVERIEVEYSLGQLLDRQFVVKRVHLVHPRLVLEEREGVTNLEALLAMRKPTVAKPPPVPEPEQPGEPFRVDLQSLAIESLEVVAALGATRLHLTNGEIRLAGNWQDGKPSAQAEVSLPCPADANLTLEDLPGEVPGGRLSLSFGLDLEVKLSAGGELWAEGALDLCRPVFPHGAPLKLSFVATVSDGGRKLALSPLRLDSLGQGAPRTLLELSAELEESEDGPRYSVRAGRILLTELLGKTVRKYVSRGEAVLVEAEANGRLGGGLPQARLVLAISDVGLAREALVQGAGGTLEAKLEPSPTGGRVSVSGRFDAARAGTAAIMFERPRVDLSMASRIILGVEQGTLAIQPEPLSARFSAAQVTGALVASNLAGSLELAGGGGSVSVADGRVILPRLTASLSGKAGRIVLFEGELQGPFVNAKLALPAGPLDAATLSELVSGRIQGGANLVNLANAKAKDASFVVDLSGGGMAGVKLRRPLQARLEAKCEEASIEGGTSGAVRLGGLALAGRLEVSALAPLALSGDLSGESAALELSLTDGRWAPGKVRFEGRGRLADERVTVETFRLDVPALANAAVKGAANYFAGDLGAKAHLAPVRIETLLAALPAPWTAGLPAVRGEVELDAAFSGKIATIALDPSGALPAARIEVLLRGLEAALAQPALEIAGLSGRILAQSDPTRQTQEVNVNFTLENLRGPALALSGLSLALMGSGTGLDELGLKGSLKAARVEHSALAHLDLSKISLSFDARLLGRKEVWFREIALDVPSLKSHLTAAGQGVWPGSADRLSELKASGTVRYRFDSDEPVRFAQSLAVRGKAALEATLESLSGNAELSGKLSFDGADAEVGALSISGMRGVLPVRQRFRYFPAFEMFGKQSPGAPLVDRQPTGTSRAYDEALRPLRGEERRFFIERVKAGELAFSQVSGALAVEEGRLSLDRLAFSFLGGDVLARMQVVYAPADLRSFSLEGEMSGMDLSRLGGFGAGASEVAGTVKLGANLRTRDIGASFHLTQIGYSTLEALLQALDPAQANPGISRLRKFLDRFKVAPRIALLDLSMGRLNMEVRFDMGIAARAASGLIEGFTGDTYRLPPLPVGGLLEKYLRF
ncbi:MAG: AsmA family protein [Myxococcales bacterium]|nr:AsmA family protein [Myxococcales bacterium]